MYKQLTPQELTALFDEQIKKLQLDGYVWNQQLSISYAAVVFIKGEDMYVFGMDGNVYHNPDGLRIKV